jgi:hypothetical protein
MGKKRKKHAWQIALEREQERLRNRPKVRPALEIPNMDQYIRGDEFVRGDQFILASLIEPGLPKIIILGSTNYSSAKSDIEYWKSRIRPQSFEALRTNNQ